MNKFRVGLSWLCVTLFVICSALLIAAAAIPKFAIYTSNTASTPTTGDGLIGLSATDSVSKQAVYIGAFNAVYVDGDTTYSAPIDSSCAVNWLGFDDAVFDKRANADALCSQFNAFRALLIVAIVVDAVVALAMSTAILQRWLPPSAITSDTVSFAAVIAIAFAAATAIACNVAAFVLMIDFVVWEFDMKTDYGISFKLAVAAAVICVIATVLFLTDCFIFYYYTMRATKQVAEVIISSPKLAIEETLIVIDTTPVTSNIV